MINLLDISDMNRVQELKRRHLAVKRAALFCLYAALCIVGGFVLGQLAAML